MYNQCTIGSTGIILQKLMLLPPMVDEKNHRENRACEPLAAVCWNAVVLEQNCRQAQ